MRNLLFVVLAVMLTACGADKNDEKFKTFEYQTTKECDKPKISFEFDASLQVPQNMNKKIKDVLRDNIILTTLGSPYVDCWNSRVLEVYADSSFKEYVDIFSDVFVDVSDTVDLEPIECATKLDGSVSYMADDVLVYKRELYTYAGGAHGMTTSTNYIFDLKTGNIIEEDDIFIPDFQRKVHDLLVKSSAPLRNDEILPAYDDGYFGASLIQPNGNVSVCDSGIVYTFNPYEIAPYCFGTIDIVIPSDEILPILNKNTVIYDHLNK